MARPLRLQFPGALYHVITRGNAGQLIFLCDRDRQKFLQVIDVSLNRYNAICHAYALMATHYHLLLETLEANLSQLMRQINGVFTQRFNRDHGRSGHLFQGRFKSILVDKDAYLLELCRYIVLNPVRAGMVDDPKDYPWSSYRATAGMTRSPDFLHTDWILSQFGEHRRKAQMEFRRFVLDGLVEDSPGKELTSQCVLGGRNFLEKLVPFLKEKSQYKEIPVRDRMLHRPGLQDIFTDEAKGDKTLRNDLIRKAHLEYGYAQSEIAAHLEIHYTTVSNILRRQVKGNKEMLK